MRLSMVSYHSLGHGAGHTGVAVLRELAQAVSALAQDGHEMTWLTSSDILHLPLPALHPEQIEELPVTCRDVVPCQIYRLAGALVIGVEALVWQRPDLHTRLFTLLCLLHRELGWQVMHAWGELAALFLGVYTACFVGVPAVVSYGSHRRSEEEADSWQWHWVQQHLAAALVSSGREREVLCRTGMDPALTRMYAPAAMGVVPELRALYQALTNTGVVAR